MAGASFSVQVLHDVVVIIDQYDPTRPTRSVTNCADEIIDWLVECEGIGNRCVIYRDTEGIWDEMIVKDGRFARFAPIRVKSLNEAIALIRERGRA